MTIIQSSLSSLRLSSLSHWSSLHWGQLSPFIPISIWASALSPERGGLWQWGWWLSHPTPGTSGNPQHNLCHTRSAACCASIQRWLSITRSSLHPIILHYIHIRMGVPIYIFITSAASSLTVTRRSSETVAAAKSGLNIPPRWWLPLCYRWDSWVFIFQVFWRIKLMTGLSTRHPGALQGAASSGVQMKPPEAVFTCGLSLWGDQ